MKVFNFILDFLYGLFNRNSSIKKEINQENTISEVSEYLKQEDKVDSIEEKIKKTSSDEVKKEDQTIVF